jgi:methionine aminopeptidase
MLVMPFKNIQNTRMQGSSELVGHGGQKMHEDPEMPNYGKRGRGNLKVW